MSSIHSFRSLCTLSSAALSLLLLAPLGGCQRGSRNDPGEDIHRATTTYGTSGPSGPSGQVTAGGAASQQMNRGDDTTRRTGVTPETPPASDRPNPGTAAGASAGGSMGNAAGGMGGTGGNMGGGGNDRTGTTHTGTTHTGTTHDIDDKTGTKRTDDNKKEMGTSSTDTTRTTAGTTTR